MKRSEMRACLEDARRAGALLFSWASKLPHTQAIAAEQASTLFEALEELQSAARLDASDDE